MSTDLIQQAFTLSEKLSKSFHCPSYIYYWDSKTHKFLPEINRFKLIPWVISTMVAITFLIFSIAVTYLTRKQRFDVTELSFLAMYCLGSTIVCGIDFSLLTSLDSWLSYNNQLIYFHSRHFQKVPDDRIDWKKIRKGNKFIKHISK